MAKVFRHLGVYKARYVAGTLVATVGVVLISLSGAATLGLNPEAEAGDVAGNARIATLAGASGGSAVTFGATAQIPAGADFMSFGPDMYNFVPGAQKTINGITLRMTTNADLQVVNSSGTVLWNTKTNANCAGSTACRLVLQNDGNLVLYGPAGALWSSATYNVPGATLLFQPREPYLTMRNGSYDVIWSSNGNTFNAPLGMLSSSLKAPQAPSVRSFMDSLAVNSHMDQYEGDAVKVHDKLNYLGIRHIRDHWPENGSLRNQYTYLADRGIKFDMIHYSNDFNVLIRDAETMAGLPNKPLIAVEGPNEINNFAFTCSGSTWTGGWGNPNGPAAKCFMDALYAKVKASAKLSGVPVYNLTGNTSAIDADKYGLLALDNHADYGNIHPYPHNQNQPHNHFLRELGSTYFSVPPNKAVITETGYQSAQTGQRTQAIYYLNIYLDAFKQGFHKTYMYELTDNAFETHGFFDTANNPKQSATALHNLTTILADSGTPREGTLQYTLSGAPKEAYSFALQRSDGKYNLIIWDERQIWNNADVTPSAAAVTVTFSRSFAGVKVFKPMAGTAATSQSSNASSVSLQLTGEPVVLELTP